MPDCSVSVVGNLTRDPEVRYSSNGNAKATIGIAVSRSWISKDSGQKTEQTSFFNVVVWGEMADHCAESLAKGMRVLVTGRIEQRSYETPEGEKKSIVEIIADEIAPSLRWASVEVRKGTRVKPAKRSEATYGTQEPF